MNTLSLLPQVQRAMQEANFFPEKRFSQNFLIDESAVHSLVRAGELSQNDCVLEIGGGTGTVTEELCKTSSKVICVEIHSKLASYLSKKFSKHSNVSIIQGDFTKLNLDELLYNKVVSSPPYAIADDIMFSLFSKPFEKGVFIWQTEFAQKLVALSGTGEYHPLSVLTGIFYHSSIIQKIPPNSFYPSPQSFSSIVVLDAKKNPPKIPDIKSFIFFVRTLFRFRNKKVRNALEYYFSEKKISEDKKKAWKKISGMNDILNEKVFLSEPESFVHLFNEVRK